MENEKVKEIKEVLENCYTTIKYHKEIDKPILVEFSDILTLINDLESENERLRTENKQFFLVDFLRLTNTIAELEKENAKLLDSVETVQNNRCVYKCQLTKNTLKQFAESLKKITCEMYLKKQLHCCIDETLNKFLKRRKQ